MAKRRQLRADDVIEALRIMHPDPEWAFLTELRIGTGYGVGGGREFVPGEGLRKAPNEAEQRLDAWAINCWPSKEHLCVAYEVKVSRADFLHELKHPRKREMGLRLSHQFYFATPKGLIKKSELPAGCGLVEVSDGARTIVPAPTRQMEMPAVLFLAALARRAARSVVTPNEVKKMKLETAAAQALAENAKRLSWQQGFQILELERLIRALLTSTGWLYEEGRALFQPGESSRFGLDEANALRRELERLGVALPPAPQAQLALPNPYSVDREQARHLRAGHSFEQLWLKTRERAFAGENDPAVLAACLVRDLLLWGTQLVKKDVDWVAALLADELLRANGYRLARTEAVVQAFAALLDSLSAESRGLFRGDGVPEAAAHAFRAAVIPGSSDRPLERRLPELRKALVEWRAERTARERARRP